MYSKTKFNAFLFFFLHSNNLLKLGDTGLGSSSLDGITKRGFDDLARRVARQSFVPELDKHGDLEGSKSLFAVVDQLLLGRLALEFVLQGDDGSNLFSEDSVRQADSSAVQNSGVLVEDVLNVNAVAG